MKARWTWDGLNLVFVIQNHETEMQFSPSDLSGILGILENSSQDFYIPSTATEWEIV